MTLASAPGPLRASRRQPPTLADKLRLARRRYRARSARPPPPDETELARRFVSRTPVREAIPPRQRLVEVRPHRGAVVARPEGALLLCPSSSLCAGLAGA
jgi:DNA-binding FadR family transcriptional regulator